MFNGGNSGDGGYPTPPWSGGGCGSSSGCNGFHSPTSPMEPFLREYAIMERKKMEYNLKFGEFGDLPGQLTEPSGIAVNSRMEFVVADANNHRVQIFDQHGSFVHKFGSFGKEDDKLMYPNRVSIDPVSDDIILTQRRPAFGVKIFTRAGIHVRSFGKDVIDQSPRGIAVNQWRNIFVILGKIMKLIIFDREGNVLQMFRCMNLQFPYSIAVNMFSEIYISDNHSHCIRVYDVEGHQLGQIGGQGLTNYPIGVAVRNNGDLVSADNHNNFNLTIFSRDGRLLHSMESKVKHAQCYDMALHGERGIVFTSRDFRVYKYDLPLIDREEEL